MNTEEKPLFGLGEQDRERQEQLPTPILQHSSCTTENTNKSGEERVTSEKIYKKKQQQQTM